MSNIEQLSTDREVLSQPSEVVWRLWREDIYGNRFVMPTTYLTEADAATDHELYTQKGHHQTYHVMVMDPQDRTEFIPAADNRY